MARFSTDGLDKFAFDFNELANIPDDVIDQMLQAEGEIIRKAQADAARSMLQGPYNQGAVEAGAKLGEAKRTEDGKAMYVTFSGTQHGNRIAEIAFINEFGKHGQPARPFIRTANESKATEAVDAAAKVYDNYLTRKGL